MLWFVYTRTNKVYAKKEKEKMKGKEGKKKKKTQRAESLTFVSRITVHTSFS